MKHQWIHRITHLYLILPFILFCLGWLRLFVAIPVALLLLWVLYQLWKDADHKNESFSIRSVFPIILLTALWVLLSGVGGYAFQNWDHNWRNAVLRDLIAYDWPVFYATPDKGPIKMLIYYVGYWLPAALAGKLLGWQFANFILFLWTWLGVFLVVMQLGIGRKASPIKILFLLIFFGGMDALGTLFFAKEYPTLWPFTTHLEIWSGHLQYSSFTTQLFWVFNQAVPAWLCCALILGSNDLTVNGNEPASLSLSQKILVWSLCFFFAPLASIGLLPYLALEVFQHTGFKSAFKNLRYDLLLASGIVFLVSYLFFSSNSAAQERGLQSIEVGDFLVFFLLEGGILWLLLAPVRWRDLRWIITGLLLLFLPFIQFGSGRDFVMRASIAPLFYLMMMTGEVVFQHAISRFYRVALMGILLIGALTPLYEINRSIYRSFEYYLTPTDECGCDAPPSSEPVVHLEQAVALELEHPTELTAEGIPTLKFMTDEISRNFIANVRQSLYYRLLSPR